MAGINSPTDLYIYMNIFNYMHMNTAPRKIPRDVTEWSIIIILCHGLIAVECGHMHI